MAYFFVKKQKRQNSQLKYEFFKFIQKKNGC